MVGTGGVRTPEAPEGVTGFFAGIMDFIKGADYSRQGLSIHQQRPGHMANGGVLTGPATGYTPNITMHGTEAIIPLAGGGVPVESPALTELINLLKTGSSNNNSTPVAPMNFAPLIEKMAENNQLLRSQLEMNRRMTTTIEDGNAINKQILSVTR